MNRKLLLRLTLIIALTGMLSVGIKLQTAEAKIDYVYIRADGRIDPPIVPINTLDNITYMFNNSLFCQIVVERSNILVDGAGFFIQGNGTGIGMNLTSVSNVTIKNLEIKSFQYGTRLYQSSNNTLIGDNIRNNGFGVWVQDSSNNSVVENKMENNTYSAWIFASDNILSRNNITNNTDTGIVIDLNSSNNTISRNNITNNARGIWLIMASNNKVYQNNFVNNTQQVNIASSGYANSWDNGLEGNYWNDYMGVDLDPDGIGDSWYEIDSGNVDHYPLMGKFHNYEPEYGVTLVSNSTVSNFEVGFILPHGPVSIWFKVSGESGFGVCRICIPHTLMYEPYNVTVDGAEPYYVNYTLYDNGTHRWIYFSYIHSEHWVTITPEFPSFILLPLFMMATLLAVMVYKRKRFT